ATLPGDDLGTDFTQVWWARVPDGASYKTLLISDINNNFALDANDLVIEFTGGSFATQTQVVLTSDFVAGVFTALVGTADGDSMVGTTGNAPMYGAGGNDTLSGVAGADDLRGQAGDDWMLGGDGADYTYGAEGN